MFALRAGGHLTTDAIKIRIIFFGTINKLNDLGAGTRHGSVKNHLFLLSCQICYFIKLMADSLLKYVTKRRNRSSDSSAEGKVESPLAKKVKNSNDFEPSETNNKYGS